MKFILETFCVQCKKCESDCEETFFRCSGCDMVYYCSQSCKDQNRGNHQKNCVKVEFYFKMLDHSGEDKVASKPQLKSRILLNLGISAYALAQSTNSYFTLDIAKEYLDRAWKHMKEIDFYIPSFPSTTYIAIIHWNMEYLDQGHCESFDAFVDSIESCPEGTPQKILSALHYPLQRIKREVILLEIEASKQSEKAFRYFKTNRSKYRYKPTPTFGILPIYIPMMFQY